MLIIPCTKLGRSHLSSGPPSFLTIFRNENIVPKMSFASSCALSRTGRALAGPRSGTGPLLAALESEMGLDGLVTLGADADAGAAKCQSLL